MKISWNCALENEAELCVDEGQKLSEKEEEQKSILDRVRFSMKTAAMYTGSISHVDNDSAA